MSPPRTWRGGKIAAGPARKRAAGKNPARVTGTGGKNTVSFGQAVHELKREGLL